MGGNCANTHLFQLYKRSISRAISTTTWLSLHPQLLIAELRPPQQISGSESFTKWLAPGSELGASWSEGSETNVILGFRVPTTIGLRKPPAGSPCSQLAPLAPRASLGPWSLWGARGYGQGGSKLKLARLPPSTLPSLQLTLSSLQPPSSLPALSSLPACSPHSSSLPSLQLTPSLLPALSSFPAHSSLLPALSSLPPCSPCSSSLPACSQLAPASQLTPSSLPSLQLAPLAPAHSTLAPSLLQLTPLAPACSSSHPACSQWPCMCWGPHHLWGVRGYGAR